MAKYLVKYDRTNCIGAGVCAAASPKFWKMNYDRDGKADLIGGTPKEDGWEEIEISDADLEEMRATAEICPVNVIHIIKKDTGEKII
ncbi:ferredoxin [Candidatus Woesearchaeota archaeon]|nr:ferredoxin [Candidatus Woesearchaeota archaeon]